MIIFFFCIIHNPGIGRKAAVYVAQNGFHVFASVRNQKDFDDLAKEAKQNNLQDNLLPIILDVTKEDQIIEATKTVQSFLSKHPHLELVSLINNAGISVRVPGEYIEISHAKVKRFFFF